MECKAYYRLPYADTYTRIVSHSAPAPLSRLSDVGTVSGFVFVPFAADASHPAVVIGADEVEECRCTDVAVPLSSETFCPTSPSEDYTADFAAFHSAVSSGAFRKLVLARSLDVSCATDSADALFHRACRMYPRAMVMLVDTPVTGCWLIASPEVLVEVSDGRCRTMALAGTMPFGDGYPQWSLKNQQEQHIVEQFVEQSVVPFARDMIKDGPQTLRAGNLMHLCTTFRFHLLPHAHLGNVVEALHPTPAVCGLPRREALEMICRGEHCERSYYSGFAGPVNMDGQSHLYVSLRCMQIHTDHCRLYAGGGIMPESTLEGEWGETENKLQTMRQCIQTNKA